MITSSAHTDSLEKIESGYPFGNDVHGEPREGISGGASRAQVNPGNSRNDSANEHLREGCSHWITVGHSACGESREKYSLGMADGHSALRKSRSIYPHGAKTGHSACGESRGRYSHNTSEVTRSGGSSRDTISRDNSPGKSIHAGSLTRLSDTTLLDRLRKLRGAERAVLVKILRYLNEVERRRLYVARGYSSLYAFCTDYLQYSRAAAWRRIQAARCVRRFPRVAKLLRSGAVTLTAVSMIGGIITPKNAEEIIGYIIGRSTRDIERLVASHRPELVIRDRVKPVCVLVPGVIENDFCRSSGAGKNLSQGVDNTSVKNRGGEVSLLEPVPTAGTKISSGANDGSNLNQRLANPAGARPDMSIGIEGNLRRKQHLNNPAGAPDAGGGIERVIIKECPGL